MVYEYFRLRRYTLFFFFVQLNREELEEDLKDNHI